MFPHAPTVRIFLGSVQFLALAEATHTQGLPPVLCPSGRIRLAPDSSGIAIDFDASQARAALKYLSTLHPDCKAPAHCDVSEAVADMEFMLRAAVDILPAPVSAN